MEKNSLIYVAGHTGLVGSAIVRELELQGYKNIITRTHEELELLDRKEVDIFFAEQRPEYIFLAAAKVGGIYANNTFPAEFIYQNLMIQTNLIDLSYKHKVKKLLFLGSSCSYPKICPQPMKEEYLLTAPLEITNEPFAIAKLAGIKMCQAYNRQYGTNFISVIPSNAYGLNDHCGRNAHVVSSLINNFKEAKVNGSEVVTVWGSGKPKREFLYVDDLANACLFLMNNYDSTEVINIGSGVETSIKDLAEMLGRITGFNGRIIYDTSKPDGNTRRFLDSSRIKAIGWKPQTSLKDGIRFTCEDVFSAS
ncbi:MAG: GDP-L-fucose synthase [Anaerohalosphaeraceae bacterium]|nr:GDP-L-fucose synthase [Anaerohalosphaeraceae bacterium]